MNVTIRRPTLDDTDELYAVIALNREHLTNLVWAASATRLSTEKFLSNVPDTEKLYTIIVNDDIVGMITLRLEGHRWYSIGYWLDHSYRGKGIMRQAVELILKKVPRKHWVEAHIREKNYASRNVLAATGFVHEFVNYDAGEYWHIWVYKEKRGFFERYFNIWR